MHWLQPGLGPPRGLQEMRAGVLKQPHCCPDPHLLALNPVLSPLPGWAGPSLTHRAWGWVTHGDSHTRVHLQPHTHMVSLSHMCRYLRHTHLCSHTPRHAPPSHTSTRTSTRVHTPHIHERTPYIHAHTHHIHACTPHIHAHSHTHAIHTHPPSSPLSPRCQPGSPGQAAYRSVP